MLKVTEVKEKAKGWLVRNEEEIIRLCSGAVCGIVCGLIGSKYSDYKHAIGMATMHGDGFIKFFDPTTGSEVKTSMEAAKLVKDFYKK